MRAVKPYVWCGLPSPKYAPILFYVGLLKVSFIAIHANYTGISMCFSGYHTGKGATYSLCQPPVPHVHTRKAQLLVLMYCAVNIPVSSIYSPITTSIGPSVSCSLRPLGSFWFGRYSEQTTYNKCTTINRLNR